MYLEAHSLIEHVNVLLEQKNVCWVAVLSLPDIKERYLNTSYSMSVFACHSTHTK